MVDMNDMKNAEQQAYDFWNKVGAWVASHPKTTVAVAAAVIILAFAL